MLQSFSVVKFQCFNISSVSKVSKFQSFKSFKVSKFQKFQSFKVSKVSKFQSFKSSVFQYSYEMVQCLVNMEWLRNAHMSFNGILQYIVS